MLFNSTNFFLFLPIVLIASQFLPDLWRKRFMTAAGYFFYGCWDWRFVGLLGLTTVVDFTVGHAVDRAPTREAKRRFLLLSIVLNLGVLGFFKYFNFFIDSAATLIELVGLHANLPTLRVILPVGISFYTFQSMAYVIDVYRGDAKPVKSFLDFAMYVSYFPQLVAGPIERAAHLVPQLTAPQRLTPGRINGAILLMLIGFTKKVLIADWIAPEVDQIFHAPQTMTAGMLLRGAYLFTFQIYGDFAGYSDIARGVSELFGIRLMINFNQPYLSCSVTEFWRRWHISLSTWLRDYLYVPLGGNRLGRWKTYRNLMLTMLIGGLWHGANWTFVVWGGLHGGMLAIERALRVGPKRGEERGRDRKWTLASFVGLIFTFHWAMFCWIFFRAPDVHSALAFVGGILRFDGLSDIGLLPLVVGGMLLAIDLPQWWADKHTILLRTPWWLRAPIYAGLMSLVAGKLLYGGRELPFIYFQF